MSGTEATAVSRASSHALGLLAGAILIACCQSGAAAATLGRSYFFANRDACATSGIVSPRECAAAFANAQAQLRDRAPRFGSASECRLRFRLCDVARPETPVEDTMSYAPTEEAFFTPAALGVEIVVSAKGVEAAPTLAIETPTRIFPYYPVSRPYSPERREEAARPDPQNAAILPPDHFEPFAKRTPFAGATTFTASALGAIAGATHAPQKLETAEERRQRLKSAPFVQ
jgi:hypothetical protein